MSVSELPELRAIAGTVLALSLAYLRLEQFQHLKLIRNYARKKLHNLSKHQEIPSSFRNSKHYKQLNALAGNRRDPDLGKINIWLRIYSILFESRVDWIVSNFMVYLATLILLVGTAHSVEHLLVLKSMFTGHMIVLWYWIMSSSLVIAIFFVLIGNRIVDSSYNVIDHDSKELGIFMEEVREVRLIERKRRFSFPTENS